MSPPDHVVVLGVAYSLRMTPAWDQDGSVGLCQYNTKTLAVSTEQTPLDVADTALHEVMHAILHEQGRESGGKVEEMYVRALATGLVGVLRDNQTFGRWLLGKVQETP